MKPLTYLEHRRASALLGVKPRNLISFLLWRMRNKKGKTNFMKCFECPLCISDPYDVTSDYDCYCLITRDFTDIESGCKRTKNFILSQDKEKLKDAWAKEEAEKWNEFAKQFEDENNV